MELVSGLGWNILWFVVVLGIMIFIHELGHHLVAKWLGIRVEVFSLGFGHRLFGFKYGDTDYRVSAIPLGGYVKMKGENYDENLEGGAEEFLSRPKLHRFAVAAAGPAMNLALAVVLLASTYLVGVPVPVYLSEPAVVGHIVAESPAAEAGIETQDRILSVGGEPTPTWEALHLAVATSPGQVVSIQFERQGRRMEKIVQIAEDGSTGTGYVGILPETVTYVSAVEPGSPADAAGLQGGDMILSARLDDITASDHESILTLIAESQGHEIILEIERQGQTFQQAIVPTEIDGRTRVGVVIGPTARSAIRIERYGLIESLGRSVERNYQMAMLTFSIVRKLLTGETSLKMMSGPIEIARFSGQAASQGWLQLVGFMALISLQLGLFNLFPIPILDGGVILLLAIEGILGRDLSLKVKERIFQVGLIFLVLLMSIVIFNDISKNI